MKRALLHTLEPGRICDVVEVGQEFEVHENFIWVNVPDDTTTADIFQEDGTIYKHDPVAAPGFAENGYMVARTIGYKGIGEQLDMIFKELQATGTISNTGPWATHIASIKAAIPKDNPLAVHEWNMAYLESVSTQGNI